MPLRPQGPSAGTEVGLDPGRLGVAARQIEAQPPLGGLGRPQRPPVQEHPEPGHQQQGADVAARAVADVEPGRAREGAAADRRIEQAREQRPQAAEPEPAEIRDGQRPGAGGQPLEVEKLLRAQAAGRVEHQPVGDGEELAEEQRLGHRRIHPEGRGGDAGDAEPAHQRAKVGLRAARADEGDLLGVDHARPAGLRDDVALDGGLDGARAAPPTGRVVQAQGDRARGQRGGELVDHLLRDAEGGAPPDRHDHVPEGGA